MAPKKLGDCGLPGEGKVWIRDSVGTEEEGFDLTTPLPKVGSGTPSTLKTACGIKTRLLDKLDDGVIRVPLPGGKSAAFLPLHLSDKTGGYYCGAIRPKVACVTEAKADGDGNVELTLRTLPSGPATEGRIRIEKNGSVSNVNLLAEFAVLPLARTVNGDTVDLRDILRAASREIDCTNKTKLDCTAERQYAAERRTMEFVRIDRRVRLPKPVRVQDVTAFLQKYAPLSGDRVLAHRAIVINEIGVTSDPTKAYASPYEVLDAVLVKSAPSFGAHQVDVGNNDSAEVEPFRAAMKRIANRPDTDSAFKSIEAARGFEHPGREYDTVTLATFHRSIVALTAELRIPDGRSAVDKTYDDYLTRAAGCFAELRSRGEPFISSKFAMLYVVDVANQSGKSVGRAIAQLALAKARENNSVAAIEQAMVEYIMKRKSGQAEKDDVTRRVGNVRSVIQQWGNTPLGGGVASNCDIKDI